MRRGEEKEWNLFPQSQFFILIYCMAKIVVPKLPWVPRSNSAQSLGQRTEMRPRQTFRAKLLFKAMRFWSRL